jgi:hypothetical protein
MVTRINGAPAQGVFFSKDVRFVSVTVGTGTVDFEADLTVTSTSPRQADVVNSELEQVLELLATRGTIIGVSVVSGGAAVNVMVDYAQAFDDAAVVAALEDEMDNTNNQIGDWTGVTIAVQEGFAAAALGTPA